MWGDAMVGQQQLDSWVRNFIDNHIDEYDTPEDVANRLADRLNADLSAHGDEWKKRTRGLHLTGYLKDIPQVWHVHNNPPSDHADGVVAYQNFPEEKTLDMAFRFMLEHVSPVIFGGQTEMFREAFRLTQEFTKGLTSHNIKLPYDTLEGHLSYNMMLVSFVGDMLRVSNNLQIVDTNLSYVAYTETGIKVANLRLPSHEAVYPAAGHYEY